MYLFFPNYPAVVWSGTTSEHMLSTMKFCIAHMVASCWESKHTCTIWTAMSSSNAATAQRPGCTFEFCWANMLLKVLKNFFQFDFEMFKIISPFETPPQEFWPCTRLLVGSLGAVRFASSFHCSRARLYTVRECFVYAMVIFCTHKQTPSEPVKFILFAPHQTNTHTHQQQAIGLDLTLVNVPRRPGQCASERERVCRDFDARST